MKRCCVPECRNKYNLHAVPYTKPDRWKAWLSICPFFRRYSFRQLENVKICNLHFLPHHFNEKCRLTSDAIPSLKLPNQRNKKPKTVLPPTNEKYLEICPTFIYSHPHKVKVVQFSSPDRMTPDFTSTIEVSPLTRESTLSDSNEPVFKLLDASHNEKIHSFNPSNNTPLNISCEQSSVSTSTHVVAHKPIHNKQVLEPTLTVNFNNIFLYPQQQSLDLIKPSVGNQTSLDSYHNEKIQTQPVLELSEEVSQSSSTSSTMPSNVESYFVQRETTPVKIRSSRCTHSHKDLIPRINLHKNEDTPRKRKLCQRGSVTRQSTLSSRELRMGHRIRKLEHYVRNLQKQLHASRQTERRLREDVAKLNDMIDELVNSELYC